MTALPESGRLDWSGVRVAVAGLGIAGFACADALLQRNATVTVVDGQDGPEQRNKAQILDVLGATVRLGDGDTLPEADLLVVSPGLRPSAAITTAALAAGMPVWGELELAWRLRDPHGAPWLFVTGTNGKTTTTLMLESILAAAGYRTASLGNIGRSLVDAVMHDDVRPLHPFSERNPLLWCVSIDRLNWSCVAAGLAAVTILAIRRLRKGAGRSS